MKKKTNFYISPYQEVDIIYIPFPEKKYGRLLKTCKIDVTIKPGSHQISQVFINTIYWFLRGELSLDNLSMIILKLRGFIPKKDEHGELDHALESGDELAYYIRRIHYPKNKSEHLENRFTRGMIGIMEYYMEHKDLIVTLPKPKWATFAD